MKSKKRIFKEKAKQSYDAASAATNSKYFFGGLKKKSLRSIEVHAQVPDDLPAYDPSQVFLT